MKKILYATLMALLITAMISTTVFAGTILSPTVYVGQNTKAAFLKITPQADGGIHILVMPKGGEGWCVTEVAAHVGLSLADFPLSGGGALIPGHFDFPLYSGTCIAQGLEWTIYPDAIDPQWAHGDHVYMAIHLVMDNPVLGIYNETGWTVRCGNKNGHDFGGGGWGLWLEIMPYDWF